MVVGGSHGTARPSRRYNSSTAGYSACRVTRALPLPEQRVVERLALAPQVIHRPRQPRRQQRQYAALAPLLQLLLLPLLGALAAAQKQTRRLAEGPAQVGVADLLAARAHH